MSAAKRFLDLLESKSLLDATITSDLRRQLEEATHKITAEAIAKLLVDNGHLTRFQATKLVAEAAAGAGGEGSSSPETVADVPALADAPEDDLGLAPVDDDLGLAPVDGGGDEIVELEDASDGLAPVDDGGELAPLDDGGGLAPIGGGGGLEPLDASGGLEPMGDGGLEPMDGGGLEPMDGGGLEPMDGGGLAAMDGGGMDAFGADPSMAAGQPAGAQPVQKIKTSVWDSKLMLVGGGSLAAMILAGIIIVMSMRKGTAEELFQKAEDSYKSEAYTQAIADYERFLGAYPDDQNASLARVRIGLARFRPLVGGNPEKAMVVAKEVLPEIEMEESFAQARPELQTLLPTIAAGFAGQAVRAETIQATGDGPEAGKSPAELLVAKAEEAMELVNNRSYIPGTAVQQIKDQLNDINEDILEARRNIDREAALRKGLAEIAAAITSNETDKAYSTRRQLLAEFPILETNDELNTAVAQITDRERDLVTVATDAIEPLTDELPVTVPRRFVFASRRGGNAAGVDGRTVFVLARGSVYALDAATGQLLWRRFVGYETLAHPQAIDDDALLVDERRHELIRVGGRTGDLQWRLPLGEPFATPKIQNGKIFLTAASGRIHEINAGSGQSLRQSVLPQPSPVSPELSTGNEVLYQPGGHSNLYVISSSTLECDDVIYLGHKPGTIRVSPTVVERYLFVALNLYENDSEIHVFATNDQGLELREATKPIRLNGHVVVPPKVNGRQILFVTDLGAAHVLAVDPSNPADPIQPAVEPQAATFATRLIGYSAIGQSRIWIGANGLTRYEVQTTQNRLARSGGERHTNDTYVAPLWLIDKVLIHARRRSMADGIRITAQGAVSDEEIWVTDVAVPIAKYVVANIDPPIKAFSAQGDLFGVTSDAIKANKPLTYIDRPIESAEGNEESRGYMDAIDAGNGRFAFASEALDREILTYNPVGSSRTVFRSKKFPAGEILTATPVYFEGGLLLPLGKGEVTYFRLDATLPTLLPFLPDIRAGQSVGWQRPVTVGDRFFIADNRRALFMVGLATEPQPSLKELKKVSLEDSVVRPLAATSGTVFAVTRGGRGNVVTAYDTRRLEKGQSWELEGQVTWGPERVGDVVMLTTDREGLVCFEDGPKLRWHASLTRGPLAGLPAVVGEDFLVATARGQVWKASGSSGEETGSIDIGEPLRGNIVVLGKMMLVPGADGVMHVTSLP